MELKDGDYKLLEGAGWFEVKGFAIRICATDEGVVVDICQNGKEYNEALASCCALDNDLETDGE